jgi:hypothetical protein
MTQEQKDLLLKDLSARLPYGVKFALSDNKLYAIKGVDLIVTDEGNWEYAVIAKGIEAIEIKYVKPYLRPMLSMTEEQLSDLTKFVANGIHDENILYDWYNRNHFDYRGLIEKGLAIDCTNLNIY